LVHHGTRLNVAWPIGERDYARATLVQRRLAVAVGAVVGGDSTLGRVHLTRELGFARAAVVALEDDECVVAHLALLQRLKHPTDLVVHGRNHRSISTAVGGGEVLLLVQSSPPSPAPPRGRAQV